MILKFVIYAGGKFDNDKEIKKGMTYDIRNNQVWRTQIKVVYKVICVIKKLL